MRLFFSHKKRPVWLFEGRPLFNKGYNFKYWDLSAFLASTLSAWHRILWGSLSFLLRLSWTQPLNFSTGFSLWGPMAGSGGGGFTNRGYITLSQGWLCQKWKQPDMSDIRPQAPTSTRSGCTAVVTCSLQGLGHLLESYPSTFTKNLTFIIKSKRIITLLST